MRKAALAGLFCLLAVLPAQALIVATVVGGAKYMKDEAYQAFMKIQVVEQVRILKETYDSSMRYYQEFQRWGNPQEHRG